LNLKKLHNTLFFLLLWSFSFGQQYTNYTTKNGLPSNHVYKITQDHQGFIWMITDKGMTRFNGKTFKTFTTKEGLPTNDIWDIRSTPDGKVWYFSKAAKLGYILNDRVYAFESAQKGEILYPIVINQNKNIVGFSDANKSYLLKDDLWVSTKLRNTKHQYGEAVIHQNVKGIIYNDSLNTLEIKDLQDVTLKKDIRPTIFKNEHRRGQINDSLFGIINDKGYTILNLENLQFFKEELHHLKTKFVRINDVNQNMQISGQDFVAFIGKDYKVHNKVEIPKKLKSHFSFIDKNDNLWIATFNNGLYFIPNVQRNVIHQLENEKAGKLQWVNNKLVASIYNSGFFEYLPQSKEFKPIIEENDFIFNAVHIDSLRTTYFITNKKLFIEKDGIRSKKLFYTKENPLELPKNLVYLNGYLYGNTSFGVVKMDPKNLQIKNEYYQNGVRDLISFQNKIVLATANGLKIISNDSIQDVQLKSNTLNKPIVRIQKINQNEVIIGTAGFGAYISNLDEAQLLEKSDFLAVQNVFVKDNSIWLATNEGIWQYTKENKTYKLKRRYTIEEGLYSNSCNAISIFNNDLIVSTDNGISIVPINQTKESKLLDLYIEKAQYNNDDISANKNMAYTANNHLDITIAMIDFSTTYNTAYQYKLTPIQKEWTKTTSNSLNFSNLTPNDYQLHIQKKELTKTFNFTITPLWWQRSISKALFFLITLSGIGFLMFWLRQRELAKKTKKLKTQKKLAEFELYALRSQMNPHFVFNSLNAIQYYLNDNKIELSEKYLIKFSKLIRMFFDFSEHKVISIKEELQLLNGYLEIEKLRFGDEFVYSIITDENLNTEFPVPAMLLQPIVENAVNHGLFHNYGKGLIKILFQRIGENSYEVIIEDNGVGREKSKEIKQQSLNKHQSKSSQILQERITLLNHSKEWNISHKITDLDTEKKQGTRVYLKFKKL